MHRERPTCPACGKKQAVRIAYGLPEEELMHQGERRDCGGVYFGGCCIGSNKWHCRACGHNFPEGSDDRGVPHERD